MINYGCHNRLPHDLIILYENKCVKWEICRLCSKRFRWNKGYKGRVQNALYLKVHARNFAQRWGATKRLYNRIYKIDNLTINL